MKYLEALASDEEDDDDDSSSSEEDDYDDSSSEEDSDEESEEDSDEEEEEDEEDEEEEERPFRFGRQRKFDSRVGRRVNQPSRVAPKAPRGSASFPPVLPSFGRRISSSYDQ